MEFAEGRDLMPRFPVPEGESEASWLIKEVERGLHNRFLAGFRMVIASRPSTRSA